MHPRYVSGSPGSFITLKIEMSAPTKPDWYTFQSPCPKGSFIEIVARSVSPPASATETSDSYAIAISVPG
jgi:hypothetical protein